MVFFFCFVFFQKSCQVGTRKPLAVPLQGSGKKKKLYTCLMPSLEARGVLELLWKVSRSGPVPGPRCEQALVGGRGGVN